jgi:hypothetical protein
MARQRRAGYARPGNKRQTGAPDAWSGNVGITSYVTPQTRERLLAISDEKDMSVAEIVRQALEDWIAARTGERVSVTTAHGHREEGQLQEV